jgi:hypothetical protein
MNSMVESVKSSSQVVVIEFSAVFLLLSKRGHQQDCGGCVVNENIRWVSREMIGAIMTVSTQLLRPCDASKRFRS